ncbi:MAG TPA: hypothetical protein VFH95_12210 [Candidatus Kapabacteria bacterium]|nr:hypothetical protein [Candidatus Kapabacteria bacterium]
MPRTRTVSRNGSHEHTTTAHRPRRSHSIAAETERPIVRPTKRITRSLPGWIPWAIGGIGLCAIVYGLFQIESIRDFARDLTEPVSDFLSGDEFEENEYAPRSYEDESDFGSGDFGSSASERLRSRL